MSKKKHYISKDYYNYWWIGMVLVLFYKYNMNIIVGCDTHK